MSKKIIVAVNEGKIKGVKIESKFSNAEFYSFYGVPYGQSTTKQARFKDPVEVKPWKNVLDATTEKQGCCQYSPYLHCYIGSEDCLYNNIHTLRLPKKGNTLRPVMVNIHPGSYYHGSPETWYYGNPDYVMHHDIVYVCVAYRLHILGFLNLGLEECSGNQGLKDIILSLKWIRNNVSFFGGDPENVTLMGSSTGGIIVHLLTLSPAAKGLFHKAIVMGGNAFTFSAKCFEENASIAIKLACDHGYEGSDVNDKKRLLHFLKKLKPEKIASNQPTKEFLTPYPISLFSPTIDTGENAVLPMPYGNLVDSLTRVPVMFGICEREGFLGFTKTNKESMVANFKSTFGLNCFGWPRQVVDDDLEAMYEEIKSFYLNGTPIEKAPLHVLVDIQTDAGFCEIYDTLLDVISADLPSSVYVYKFLYESKDEVNSLKDLIGHLYETLDGTFHSSDCSYWACMIRKEAKLTNRTRNMIEIFTKLLTHFAETGNPNHENLGIPWQPSTPEHHCYLSINDTLNLEQGKLTGERMEFWQRLKEKYGKKLAKK